MNATTSAGTSVPNIPFDDSDRLIDIKALQVMLGFRSRTAVHAAEERRDIPPSLRISGSRRWRLSAVRAAIANLEAAALAKADARCTGTGPDPLS
jgi:predicted DNA-binding transcriptional regulator AlpA